jgi:Secretion system C-terminal sorting domain
MKLISTLFTKKTQAVALLMLMIMFANARTTSTTEMRRVFWNKFEAIVTNENTVVLTWNVTEYNNKSFIVQHSVDGIKWEDIAFVQSQNSAQSMTDYTYTHNNKLRGKQFHRLQDLDIDSRTTGFSPVKTLILSNDKLVIAIWPNPATDHIVVANSKASDVYTKVKLFDLAGKVVSEKKLGPDINEIAINELTPGTYIVKLETSKGTSCSQKIVKQ